MQRYFDVVQNRQGTAVVGATVTVYDANGNLATLYSNNSGAASSNPVYTNSDGEYAFYAANGTYSITIAQAGYATETKPGVVLFDPSDSGASGNVQFLQAGTGAQVRSVQSRLSEIVSVKDFGAVGDGTTDDTAAIQAAIDVVSSSGGSVFVPAGVYRVSQIVLRSYVTLQGARQENGWARLSSWDKGTVIRSLNNSSLSPIKIQNPAINWGLQDIIVDANKANQSNPGVHCVEHLRTTVTGSPGGLIDGCKFVNATGFGLYIMGAHPLEISNSFIMSGIYLGRTFDTLVTGCSIDGTDSKHPAIWLGQSEHISFVGNFVFRGESISQTLEQTYTVDTVSNTITVTDATQFYDGQPVNLRTTGVFPELTNAGGFVNRGNDTYIVKKVSGNVLQLWWANNYTSTGEQVLFNTTGSGIQTITSGSGDIIEIARGKHIRIADCRVAGSPAGALYVFGSTYIQYDNNDHWALNWNNSGTQPAVNLVGCQFCTFTNSQLGDSQPPVGKTLVREAVLIQNDTSAPAGSTSVSEGNIFTSNQYFNTQGLFVNDISTPIYEQRNLITGWNNLYGQTATRIFSPQTRREPTRYYYNALATTTQVPTSSNTNIAWAPSTFGDPTGIGAASSLVFPSTSRSLISIKGNIGFSNRQAGAYYILVFVTVNSVAHRFLWEQQANTAMPTYIIVPFDIDIVVSSDATITVSVFQNSGVTLDVNTTAEYSRLNVTKIADYTA